jgi:hypothetical protein
MFRFRWERVLLPAVLGVGMLFTPDESRGQSPGGGVPVDPAEKRFKELDVSQDGQLSRVESMGGSGRLGRMFDQYDTNKDDVIDLDEYKVYYAAANGLPPPPEPERPKPTVYRYGKLPQGLPAYFTEGDTDKDGQVGLYEWVQYSGNGEEKLAEFKKLDLNGDGLLTPEEYLRTKKASAPPAASGKGPPSPGTPTVSPLPGGGQPPVARPPVPQSSVGQAAERPKKEDKGVEPKRPPAPKK